jgi:tetratricopeptide (TPR) repeat protein
MKKKSILVAFASLLVFCSMPAWSQTAQVVGSVTDAGKPVPNVQLVLTNIDNGKIYKVKADKNGKFDMLGVIFGPYQVEVSSPSGDKLFNQKVMVSGAEGPTSKMDLDISQDKEGNATAPAGTTAGGKPGEKQPKYTKEQIEAIKTQNAKAVAMNTLITQAQTALNAKNWPEAENVLNQMVAQDPNRWEFYQALGNAQLNQSKFEEAVQSYGKGIPLAQDIVSGNAPKDSKNPSNDPAKAKTGLGQMLTNEGNAYLKLKKNPEAVEAFTKAAAMDPNPATAYFNLCATQYNTGNTEGALAACDKAIGADPTKADAYFIKGSLLIGASKMDKDGKMQAPAGTSEALNKYLELAPDGNHAADVKEMLKAIGAKIETTYKQRKK